MTVSNPAHWKELYGPDKGDKWNKIVEMITQSNNHSARHEDGGGDEINGNLDLGGLKLGGAPASYVTDIDTVMQASPTDSQVLTALGIAKLIGVEASNKIWWVGIPSLSANATGHVEMGIASGRVHNILTGDVNGNFYIPAPANIGNKKLIITTARVVITDAEEWTDYVTQVYLFSWVGSALTTHFNDTADKAIGTHNYSGTYDMNGAHQIMLRVRGTTATQYALDYTVSFEGYYTDV